MENKSFNPCRVFKCAATKARQLGRGWIGTFQSLSGFQVRCNSIAAPDAQSSNPVSIPVGFSSALQPSGITATFDDDDMFQSLSGFQVRCNPGLRSGKRPLLTFQSLSGFQVRCNRGIVRRYGSWLPGFNPCRVFKCAATSIICFSWKR